MKTGDMACCNFRVEFLILNWERRKLNNITKATGYLESHTVQLVVRAGESSKATAGMFGVNVGAPIMGLEHELQQRLW